MARRAFVCNICNNTNLPSACAACINFRLLETYKLFKRLSKHRDDLHFQVEACLKAKHETDQQHQWRIAHKDRITKLKEKLRKAEDDLKKGKEQLVHKRQCQEAQSHSLAIAKAQLAKRQVEQLGQHQPDLVRTHSLQLTNISSELQQWRRSVFRLLCKFFPLKHKSFANVGGKAGASQSWTICGINLPIGDDPHSVSKQELEASVGCLFQLVQLAATYLCAPLLHAGRFRGSSSKIWQRSSYWDGSSNSGEYPLFIAAHDRGLLEEHTFSDKGTSIMGFSTIESFGVERLGDGHSTSSLHGSRSVHPPEMRTDVQKGIKLLKWSVSCVSSYGFNELLSSMPSNMTTYQAFAELMALLASREIKLRSTHQTSSLADSVASTASTLDMHRERRDGKEFKVRIGGSSNLNSSLYCIGKDSDYTEIKAGEYPPVDGWDMVEHATFPPPPSNSEDVEHWTRAMFVDARK